MFHSRLSLLKNPTLSALLLLISLDASAEWPFFYRSQIVAVFDWSQRKSSTLQEPREFEQKREQDDMRLGFDIQQGGYWYDPRIISFSYNIQPSFSELEDSNVTGIDNYEVSKSSNQLLNYAINIDFLNGANAPVEGSWQSSLTDNEYKATLAGITTQKIDRHSAILRWKFEPFPLTFSAIQSNNYRRSGSAFGQSVVERDDLYRSFAIRGSSSKLNILLERETRSDQLPDRDNDQVFDTAQINHFFEWGRNSRAETRFEHRRRQDRGEVTTNRLTQSFWVKHTDNVNSILSYGFNSISGLTRSDDKNINYGISHTLYQNLTSTAFIYAQNISSEVFNFDDRGAGLALDYNKVFWGTSVGLQYGFKRANKSRDSKQGFVEVIDESYDVPVDGRLILSGRYIQQGSIVVVDATEGFIFSEGLDYLLLSLESGLTILSVIPGSEIRIGQPVLVSYLAALEPSGEFEEEEIKYGISVARGGFSFRHSAIETNTDLLEGFQFQVLPDPRQRNTALSYNWSTPNGGYQVSLSSDLWQDRFLRVISDNLRGAASLSISPKVNMNMSLAIGNSNNLDIDNVDNEEQEGSELETDYSSLSMGVNWRATRSLNVSSSITAWKRSYDFSRDQLESYDEDVVSAELRLDYRFRRFSANFSAYYNDWSIYRTLEDSDYLRTDSGFRLTVRRSF